MIMLRLSVVQSKYQSVFVLSPLEHITHTCPMAPEPLITQARVAKKAGNETLYPLLSLRDAFTIGIKACLDVFRDRAALAFVSSFAPFVSVAVWDCCRQAIDPVVKKKYQ